jgi:hypothetical protein
VRAASRPRHLLLWSATAAVIGVALTLGGIAAVATGVLLLPVLAWRYDNDMGTWFVLAMMLVMIMTVLTLLLVLAAARH